jgi:hypothetical protein
MKNLDGLRKFNRDRSAMAAERRAIEAESALAVIKSRPAKFHISHKVLGRWESVLRLRIDNPTCTLSELAVAFGGTKDQYAAHLRRAIDYAKSVDQ